MSRYAEIQNFVSIVDAGSLSRASRRSGLAVSAVSKRLKDLELRTGATLINRSTRKLSLTDAGRDFYYRCKQIIADLDEAELNLQEATCGLKGRIRIAAPVTFSELHLAPLLNDFMVLHQDVEIDLDLNDRQVDVIDEGFDLAIRIGRLSDSSLIARRLTRIRHIPAASPALLERFGHPQHPEDLKDYPMLQYRPSQQITNWDFERPDGSRGTARLNSRFVCNNGSILTNAAAAALGIIIEPTFICSPLILSGVLEPLFPDHIWSDNAAFAIYPAGRAVPRRVRALVDHLATGLSPEPHWDRDLMRRYPLK